MKFCRECESVMSKNTTTTGVIIYHCRCQLTVEGQPDDTLMAEGFLETTKTDLKHIVFIENAPFDPAGNIVLKDCLKCGLNFLTMIRVGVNETTIYSCSCGYSAKHDDYMKEFVSASNTAPHNEKKNNS